MTTTASTRCKGQGARCKGKDRHWPLHLGVSPSAVGTDSPCTRSGFTRCNLRRWCFSFYPLAQIPDLHSGNLHCVVVVTYTQACQQQPWGEQQWSKVVQFKKFASSAQDLGGLTTLSKCCYGPSSLWQLTLACKSLISLKSFIYKNQTLLYWKEFMLRFETYNENLSDYTWYLHDYCTRWPKRATKMHLHSRCEQSFPVHPSEQVHLLGAVHCPFTHGGEQKAAVKKRQGACVQNCHHCQLTRSVRIVWERSLMYVILVWLPKVQVAIYHCNVTK